MDNKISAMRSGVAQLCECIDVTTTAAASLIAAIFIAWFSLYGGNVVCRCQVYAAKRGMWHYLKYNFTLAAVWIIRWYRWICEQWTSDNVEDPDDHPVDSLLLDKHQVSDSLMFCGYTSDNSWIIAKIERHSNREAALWLSVHINGVGLFETPGHPDSTIVHSAEKEFRAGHLHFELLECHRRWRISFNGPLRKSVAHNLGEAAGGQGGGEHLTYVKFVLTWEALTGLYFPEDDVSLHHKASALASTTLTKSIQHAFSKGQQHVNYAQVGGMHGTMQIDYAQPIKMRFRSTRCRRTGPVVRWTNCTFQSAALEDGTTILLSTFENRDDAFRLASGCIFAPNTEKSLIDYIVDDAHRTTDQSPSSNHSLHFWADGREYELQDHCNGNVVLYNGKDWETQTTMDVMSFAFGNVKGFGVTEMTKVNETPRPPSRENLVPLLKCSGGIHATDDDLLLNLNDELCAASHVVGGKACQLSFLSQVQREQNFIVPPAVCLTVKAFFAHLAMDEPLQGMLVLLQDAAAHYQESESDSILQRTCNDISSYIRGSTLSSNFLKIILEKMSSTFGRSLDGLLFAVRSSALGEDAYDSSSAGQLETYIAVKGEMKSIENAILSCWASQFSFRTVQYMRQRGQILSGGMGVLIQEMAPCEYSGVLFTREPVSGNPSVMTIQSAPGLGEAVVSGHVDPDTITVARNPSDKCRILMKRGGTTKLQATKDGDEPQETGLTFGSCLLPDDIILRLCDIGIKLEQRLGCPTDIEWTTHGGLIYIIQARPMTALDQPDEYEIVHEFDSPRSKDDEFWTLSNIGEILPAALTPLTITTSLRAMEKAAQDVSAQCNGYKRADYGHMFFKLSHGRPFINLHFLEMSNEYRSYAGNRRILELSFIGHVLPNMSDAEINAYNPPKSIWQRAVNACKFVQCIRKAEVVLTKWNSILDSYSVTEATAAVQIYIDICQKLSDLDEVWAAGYPCSMKAMAGAQVIATLLAPGCKKYSPDVCHDVARLLSACGDVVSATVPVMIENIARCIRQQEICHNFVKMVPEDASKWLLSTSGGEAGLLFKEFISCHGHRAISEIELIEKSWAQDPEKCVSVIQQTVLRRTIETKRKVIADADTLVSSLKTPLSFIRKKLIRLLLPSAWSGVSRREWSKCLQVKMNDKFKQAYWKLALAMKREGRIPDEQLLFFFTHTEIGKLISTRSPTLVLRAQKRKKLYPHIRHLNFSRDQQNVPKPMTPDLSSDKKVLLRVTGSTASLGKVRGKARVLTSLEAASTIQAGDILVVRSIDIGWSPYFPVIAGLVTEIGGLMSHGAVIAREYGIPCLVSCQGAMSCFKTGDLVEVSGETGEIVKLQCYADCPSSGRF